MNPLFFFCGIGLLSMSVGAATNPSPDLVTAGAAAPTHTVAPTLAPEVREVIDTKVIERLYSQRRERASFSRAMLPEERMGTYRYAVKAPKSSGQGPIAFEVFHTPFRGAERPYAEGRVHLADHRVELRHAGHSQAAWSTPEAFIKLRLLR